MQKVQNSPKKDGEKKEEAMASSLAEPEEGAEGETAGGAKTAAGAGADKASQELIDEMLAEEQ